jgi:dTDP-glucose 4,6-dehydratase
MNIRHPHIAPSTRAWSLEQDLEFICDAVGASWETLHGARLFLTGGTGFIGCWLLESLRFADQRLDLGIEATILTRDPDAFRRKAPHLANHASFSLLSGDVTSFGSPAGAFTHIVHGATDASAALNESRPLTMFDTVLEGTRRTLDLAVEKSARVLFLSSGAIYGQQPWDVEHVDESWRGAPDCTDARATYAEAKRAAEMLCAIYAKQWGTQISIARIFALLGPYLPLGTHFAAGNFIRDAIEGKAVEVKGNGLPCRSYLYASDLAVWLWRMLAEGEAGRPYNVGSDETVSVAKLAERVAHVIGNGAFDILGANDQGWNPGRYVPDTTAIRRDLGLTMTVSLDEAIRRTALWNGWKGKH